jgi:hypothetical protein
LRPELIIGLVFIAIIAYIVIESSVNNKKISTKKTNSKNTKNKKDNKDTVELQSVIVPQINHEQLREDSDRKELEEAGRESLEYEINQREKLKKIREDKLQATRSEGQQATDTKLEEMRERLNSIDLSEEERDFIEEVENLSPELKAILFADVLKRKGY